MMILRAVLKYLLKMKETVSCLASFFRDLQSEISQIADYDIDTLRDSYKLGHRLKTVRKMKTSQLRIMKIHIRATFAHAKAATYVAVSKKSIIPGIRLLTEFRQTPEDTDDIEQLVERLFKYAEDKGREISKYLDDSKAMPVVSVAQCGADTSLEASLANLVV